VEVTSPEFRSTEPAVELGQELSALRQGAGAQRYLIDFSRVRYASSTAFAVILGFAREVQAAGGQLKISGMTPEVLVGDRIIALNRVVDLFEEENSALSAF
jgi:anti-anti-sigma factor